MLNTNAHLGVQPGFRRQQRHPLALRVASPEFRGRTQDVSASGARLNADGPIKVGRVVPLKIDFEGFEAPMDLSAKVRWSQSYPPFECGVEFQDLRPGQVRELHQLIDAATRVEGFKPSPTSQTSEIEARLTHWQENRNFLALTFENRDRRVRMRFFQPRILRQVPHEEWEQVCYVQALQIGEEFYRVRFLESPDDVVLDLVGHAPTVEILTFAPTV